jgi:hypothetical protein
MAAAAAGLVAALVAGLIAASGAVFADGVCAKAMPEAANRIVIDLRVVVRIFMSGILPRRVGDRQA